MAYRLFFLAAIFFVCGTAKGQTVLTLRPGPLDGKDASIEELMSPNGADGADENFLANAWTTGGNPIIQRSMVSFNLSTIPTNAVIDSAFLSFYCNTTSSHTQRQSWYPGSPYNSNEAYLQRITSSWNDQTVTWNTKPTTTAVNQVSLLPSTSVTQDYPNINVTQLIQDMVQNPGSSFGFMLQLQNETIYRSWIFASSNHPDSTKRPKLVVNYHVPSTTAVQNVNHSVRPLVIAPNPAHGLLNIQLPEGMTEATIYVTDATGKVVYKNQLAGGQNDYQLDFSALSPGFYIVNAASSDKFAMAKLVIF